MARTLGSIAVGSIVKLWTDDYLDDYLVVHQGKPSSMYDESCNGTWLLKKDISYIVQWHSSESNDYQNSDIRDFLEVDILNHFTRGIKEAIKQVKLPYCPGTGVNGQVSSGASGLQSKCFLLSAVEVGGVFTGAGGYILQEGGKLSYFISGDNTNTTANTKRVAYRSGAATAWWLRSPRAGSTTTGYHSTWNCTAEGKVSSTKCTGDKGLRPAVILPQNLNVLDSGEVVINQPPNQPSSITVSEPVKGGKSATVSWGASTDADGNLSGYRLERSVNNAAFQQIHDGNTLTFSDNITYGWQTVAYRVRAYDSAGAVSGYTTSRTYTVINNSAPTTPPWLNIPAEIKGGKPFEISWGSSTDVDGNLAGYQLGRSLNGGAFSQIHAGANQKYTDTVAKGTNTAAYRVRAYDTENAQSGYAVSDTRKIINNTPPSISGEDSQLGTKNEPFSISYSVSDPDGDTITVTEKLDNQVLRTFTAEAGKEYQVTLDADRFLQILNGSHTLIVTATDALGESAVRTWTWTKNITHISIVKKVPKEPADGGCPYKCLLNLNSIIPTGALVTVEVCNNGFDQQPTWEECTAGARAGDVIFFSNRTKTAEKWGVNFRVTISRSGAPGDCYVTGVSGNFEEERNA